MEVDGAGANGTAAGQRNGRVARAGDQRAQHVETGAHFPHLFIGRDRAFQLGRVEVAGRLALRPVDFDAQCFQQLRQETGVREARHIGQRDRLVGEQARDHELQGRVLGAGNANTAVQLSAANDVQSIHGAHL
jgi:hypothetical protein